MFINNAWFVVVCATLFERRCLLVRQPSWLNLQLEKGKSNGKKNTFFKRNFNPKSICTNRRIVLKFQLKILPMITRNNLCKIFFSDGTRILMYSKRRDRAKFQSLTVFRLQLCWIVYGTLVNLGSMPVLRILHSWMLTAVTRRSFIRCSDSPFACITSWME